MSGQHPALETAVRAWAKGMYPLEAGVELLIGGGRVYPGAPWLALAGSAYRGGQTRYAVDVDKLLDASGVWSGGERRLVRIAASLLGGPTVDLHEDISGLDQRSVELVLAAVLHANGRRPEGWGDE